MINGIISLSKHCLNIMSLPVRPLPSDYVTQGKSIKRRKSLGLHAPQTLRGIQKMFVDKRRLHPFFKLFFRIPLRCILHLCKVLPSRSFHKQHLHGRRIYLNYLALILKIYLAILHQKISKA